MQLSWQRWLAAYLAAESSCSETGWINRRDQQQRDLESLKQRRTTLKALIAAELVNMAAGLIGAKDLVDAALTTWKAGGLSDHCDLSRHLPREMPFANSLEVELLTLEQPATDRLATLRRNLVITKARLTAGNPAEPNMFSSASPAMNILPQQRENICRCLRGRQIAIGGWRFHSWVACSNA